MWAIYASRFWHSTVSQRTEMVCSRKLLLLLFYYHYYLTICNWNVRMPIFSWKKNNELFHSSDAVDFKWTVCTSLFIRFMLIADQQNRTNEQKQFNMCAICIINKYKMFLHFISASMNFMIYKNSKKKLQLISLNAFM